MLYQGIVDGLVTSIGIRPEDVFINLVEVKKENWSFGNGMRPDVCALKRQPAPRMRSAVTRSCC